MYIRRFNKHLWEACSGIFLTFKITKQTLFCFLLRRNSQKHSAHKKERVFLKKWGCNFTRPPPPHANMNISDLQRFFQKLCLIMHCHLYMEVHLKWSFHVPLRLGYSSIIHLKYYLDALYCCTCHWFFLPEPKDRSVEVFPILFPPSSLPYISQVKYYSQGYQCTLRPAFF